MKMRKQQYGDKNLVGRNIERLRKEKGITQKELADYLNVSDKTVSHWEREESAPDISILPVLAETLGVTVDELLKEIIRIKKV